MLLCAIRFPFRNLSFACDLTTCRAALAHGAAHSTHEKKKNERYGLSFLGGKWWSDGNSLAAKRGKKKTRKIFLRVFFLLFFRLIFYDCSLTILQKKMADQHFYGSLIFLSNNHKKDLPVFRSFSLYIFSFSVDVYFEVWRRRKKGRKKYIYIRGQRGKSAKAIKHSIAIMAPLSSGHRQPEKGGPFERERLFLSLCISFFFHPVRVRIQCAVMVMKMRVSKVSKREIDMYSTRCRKRNNFLFGRHLTI